MSGGNGDKFCSQVTGANFLRVDLGAGMSIGSVIVRHAQAGGESASFNTRDYDIQISNDGANFTRRRERVRVTRHRAGQCQLGAADRAHADPGHQETNTRPNGTVVQSNV